MPLPTGPKMNHPRPPVSPEHLDPGFEPTQTLAPSHDALPAGSRLAEYEVERVLGEGGFGIVYLAADHGLQRHVAIKEYLPAALAARGARASVTLRATSHSETFKLGLRSFVNEARLLARFDHPSLVRVYRFWEANGTAYMVMPYYEGTTLAAARMAMTQPPDEAWLRSLLLSLMGALEVLHASSCYHRDIAPDNILLLPDGRPVLLDFGAARRVIGDRTQTLTAILKPAFAPIEQYAEAGHLQQGPWTDLYALGAVMYYLISGRSPLPSTVRAVDDQMKPLSEVTESLRQTFPDLRYSPSFLATIEWALSVRPKDRPQTVAQLRDALSKPGWARETAATATPPKVADTAAATTPVAATAAPVPPAAAPAQPAAVQPSPAPETPAADVPLFTASMPPPAASPSPSPAASPPSVSPPTLSDEIPSDAAVMAALNAALGSIPPSRPDPAWAAVRAEEDGFREQQGSRSGAGARWAVAVALLVALGLGAWQWHENRTAEELLRRLANTSTAEESAVAGTAEPARPQPPAATTAGPVEPMAAPLPPEPPQAAASADAVAAVPPPEAAPVSARGGAEAVAAPEVEQIETAPPAAGPVKEAAVTPEPEPVERPVAAVRPSSPRAACAPRTNFSLYYCMQTQCKQGHFYNHPQCIRLREHDEVD